MSPSQPVPRMTHMYIQGRVRCTLTNETLANTLVWPQTAKPVDVNAAWDLPDDVSLPFLPSDALAYIIFTSGSTGIAKVLVDGKPSGAEVGTISRMYESADQGDE